MPMENCTSFVWESLLACQRTRTQHLFWAWFSSFFWAWSIFCDCPGVSFNVFPARMNPKHEQCPQSPALLPRMLYLLVLSFWSTFYICYKVLEMTSVNALYKHPLSVPVSSALLQSHCLGTVTAASCFHCCFSLLEKRYFPSCLSVLPPKRWWFGFFGLVLVLLSHFQ